LASVVKIAQDFYVLEQIPWSILTEYPLPESSIRSSHPTYRSKVSSVILYESEQYASAIDTAAYWYAYCDLPEKNGLVSIDLKVDFLAPVIHGKVIINGQKSRRPKANLQFSKPVTLIC
jgi:hypothetical protein